MRQTRSGLGPVIASAVAAGGTSAWMLVFIEESRCDRGGLARLTVFALLLTLAPTLVALVTKAAWWVGVLLTGATLAVLVLAFRPGGVYDCYRISG